MRLTENMAEGVPEWEGPSGMEVGLSTPGERNFHKTPASLFF